MKPAAIRRLVPALGLLAMLAVAPALRAGEGHDHGDAPAAASRNGPHRLPDGSVFLPKPAQRQLQLRTLPMVVAGLPRSVELAGKVVMDPNAGGKVQAALAGRLEAGPGGLPTLGQAVRQGQVLAYVVPTAGALERSSQQAQQAEWRTAHALAERRLQRLRELADTVPRKEIEAAEAERDGLAERLAALGAGLAARDALRAPVSGVIAAAPVVAGQVLEPRELVFEVVDPNRLRIEALAYEPAQALDIASAFLVAGPVPAGGAAMPRVALKFLGAGRSLREQALPLVFGVMPPVPAGLALGQPVAVFAQSTRRVRGLAVPLSALQRNPANQTIVWVKRAPERFEPRAVLVEPLDGASVAVTSGLSEGDRVVTQGASLLNQVR